jgi:hypothetical protein
MERLGLSFDHVYRTQGVVGQQLFSGLRAHHPLCLGREGESFSEQCRGVGLRLDGSKVKLYDLCCMKALVAPGVVQISSSPARAKFAPLNPPRPPCFLQLWRDCTNLDAYLVFANGDIYHYDTPSDETAVALTVAVTHGLAFNQGLRRSFSVPGGYEFVGSIPGTANLIYQFPPYPGTDPGPCIASLNFNDLIWDSPPDTDTPTGTGFNTFSNFQNSYSMFSICPNVDNSNATGSNSAQLTATLTADVACNLQWTLSDYNEGFPGSPSSAEFVVLDSTFTLFLNVFFDNTTPMGVYNFPFTVPATAVMPLIVGYSTNSCSSIGATASIRHAGVLTPAM